MSRKDQRCVLRRAPNFSGKEEDVLVKLLVQYKHIIENKRTDAANNQKKLEAWVNIAQTFNARSDGVYRSEKILHMKYLNMKKRTKKKLVATKNHVYVKRESPDNLVPESPLEESMKKMMGVQLTGLASCFDNDAGESKATSVEPEFISIDEDEDVHQEEADVDRLWNTNTSARVCYLSEDNTDRISESTGKSSLEQLQEQCLLEEHKLKLKLMQEAHYKHLTLMAEESQHRRKMITQAYSKI